jgi:perosamine synthetase
MQTKPDHHPDCGNMAMSFGRLLRKDPSGGVAALFQGRRISYSFNARVAIRRACDVLGLKPGDEVLVPAYSCGSETDPLRHAGLQVSFYPVDRLTGIAPAKVASLITGKTRAIYLIHYFGFLHPATEAIRKLCDEHGLFMIEDCALSLLSGKSPAEGRTGDVSVFCFYKFFPTLAGGALVINAEGLPNPAAFSGKAPIRLVGKPLLRAGLDSALGRNRITGLLARLRPDQSGTEPQTPVDFPDMPASYYFDPALEGAGISRFTTASLKSFNPSEAVAIRRGHYQRYLDLLSHVPSVTPLFPKLQEDACPLSMPVVTTRRDALAQSLSAQGIAATPWWSGYNRHHDWQGFEDARFLKDHVLSLPLHQELSAPAIRHIVDRLAALLTA